METAEKNEAFVYSYSSEKQREIESIREKYVNHSQQDDILGRMKAMDRQAEKNALKLPVLSGSVGCLFLGLGMCGVLVLSEGIYFVLGIIIGVIGIVLMTISLPLYQKRVKEEREKIAPEILKLADEADR